MGGSGGAPGWLLAAFPAHQWATLRSCALRVPAEGGAGIDLEAAEQQLGYTVDAVAKDPGQDPALRSGTAVIAIGGVPLIGLGEEELGAAFGSRFRDGAQLLLLDAEELLQAARAQEVPGSVARIELNAAASSADRLAGDLATFADRAGLWAELSPAEGEAPAAVTLAGARDKICAARAELGAMLAFHGAGPLAGASSTGAETLDVGGMVVQSLPARGRRRKRYVEPGEEQEEDAAADGADGEEGEEEGEPKRPRAKAKAEGLARDGAAGADSAEGGAGAAVGKELHQYEYMDHTADVILHSWGTSLREAIAQVCVCFFSYMTDLEKIEVQTSFEVEASGHDILDMLYHLLDEFLFHFGTKFIMCRHVEIVSFDEERLKIRARGFGERFDLEKHPQGTEIKAITMHQMKILTPTTLTTEEGTIERTSDTKEGGMVKEGFPYECYVLVDI